jgi:sulfide:quinone oxidoreductase
LVSPFYLTPIGGFNAAALLKFMQAEDMHYKAAIVTDQSKFVLPENYFTCSHEHVAPLKLESSTVSAQVEPWSRCNIGVKVTEYKPTENKLVLSTGQEYTYKSLVLAPGFDHKSENLDGLKGFEEEDRGENRVWGHAIDNKERVVRNRYHGWNHPSGDMICYNGAAPYKGEGTDFYAFYYEHFLRQDQIQGRAHRSAKIQYWSPNKQIVPFSYMNEVMLDECHKRGIEVHLGWEMQNVRYNEIGEKIATFKNVDSGEVIEKPFTSANINPPSKAHAELVSSGIAQANGTIDVNKYTL